MKWLKHLAAAVLCSLALAGAALAGTPDHDIVILYTNDVHCGVDTNIGYAGLALYKKHMQAETPYVALVDAGDATQGGTVGTLSEGKDIIRLMNMVGYDAAVPGNHEFDYKMPAFFECAELLDCGYIACNIKDLGTGKRLFPAWKMLEFGDTKVAFVGVGTPETITKTEAQVFLNEKKEAEYTFEEGRDGEDLYETVQAAVEEVREKGADYVILLAHLGETDVTSQWSSMEVVAHVRGVDAVIDGHSHEVTPGMTVQDPDGRDVIITQTGTKLANIGKMVIDTDGKLTTELISEVAPAGDAHTYTVKRGDNLGKIARQELGNWLWWEELLEINSDKLDRPEHLRPGMVLTIPDSSVVIREGDKPVSGDRRIIMEIEKLRKYYEAALATPVIHSSFRLAAQEEGDGSSDWLVRDRETNLGDMVTDAYREIMGADVAVVNGGALRSSLEAGDITFNDLLELHPFGNGLCLAEVKGQQLIDILEMGANMLPEKNGGFMQVSGITLTIDATIPSPVQKDDTGKITGIEGEYRVRDVMVDGEPLDPDKTYTLASNEYLIKNGGDGTRFEPEAVLKDCSIVDVDGVAEYLWKMGGEMPDRYKDPDGQGRITVLRPGETKPVETKSKAEVKEIQPKTEVKETQPKTEVKETWPRAEVTEKQSEKI